MGDFFNNTQFEANVSTIGNQDERSDGERAPNNHVHVSLSQVVHLTRREDGLVIHRQKIHSITAIGVVISVEESNTKNIYLLDDYTNGGPVEAQYWRSENDGTNVYNPPPPVMERSYIRIVGQARFDERKPFIVAYNIENITNPCEINRHFLEVIQDTLLLAKRKSNTLQMRCGDLNVSTTSRVGGSAFDQASSAVMTSGFTEVQRAVLTILNKYGRGNDGLKRFEVHNYMVGTSKSIIDEAIAFLVNEGHIFTTLNDDTFKSTDF